MDNPIEIMKAFDEVEDCRVTGKYNFYVLKEAEASRKQRITIKDLKQHLPVEAIRRNQLENLDEKAVIVEAEGEFYPDLIEENGVYFISLRLQEFIRDKFFTEQLERKIVAFVTPVEKRVEEYYLLVPPEIDCVVPGTIRYDQNHNVTYLELDTAKLRHKFIFKIKGFPHLIVTAKINRIDFAGLECVRLENYFDYEGARERTYKERRSGEKLKEAKEQFTRQAQTAGLNKYILAMEKAGNQAQLTQEIREGLERVLAGCDGRTWTTEWLAERRIRFELDWQERKIRLAPVDCQGFAVTEFGIPALETLDQWLQNLPESLQSPGRSWAVELLYRNALMAGQVLDNHPEIHQNTRFRLLLRDSRETTVNPPLFYEYQAPLQRQVESATDFRKIDLSRKDLREVDLRGKNLAGLKIVGSNLRRAKFNGSNLAGARFEQCDLTGADLRGCDLSQVQMVSNTLDMARFDRANLKNARIAGSDLYHTSFVQADLTGAQFVNTDLSYTYFYKAVLNDVTMTVGEMIADSVFRMSELRNARLAGAQCVIQGCDFRNADLRNAQLEANWLLQCNFTKSNLINTDFSRCEQVMDCTFRLTRGLGAATIAKGGLKK